MQEHGMPGVLRWVSALAGGTMCLGKQWHSAAAGRGVCPQPPLSTGLAIPYIRGTALHICTDCSRQCNGAACEGASRSSLPAEREIRKSTARMGSRQKPAEQTFQVENKETVQGKNLVRFAPWLQHST